MEDPDRRYYLDRVADFADALGLEMIAVPDDLDEEFALLDKAAEEERRKRRAAEGGV